MTVQSQGDEYDTQSVAIEAHSSRIIATDSMAFVMAPLPLLKPAHMLSPLCAADTRLDFGKGTAFQ